VAATGVAGLDDILGGGLTAATASTARGMPGSGKTTLAFQFLLEGVRRGESVLYRHAVGKPGRRSAPWRSSHGWDIDGIAIRELVPSEQSLEPGEQYTVFHPSEVELSETTKKILDDVDKLKPARIVFDSLSELRLLAGNPLRYRRQILALKQFFAGRRCTVLLLDDLTSADHDLQVQSIAHGALLLEHSCPIRPLRRRLRVTKFRGSDFRGGFHDYAIRRGGLQVYPRLVAAEHRQASMRERMPSGLPGLDKLLGGGLERGTSTLIVGAAGTGKSTVTSLFCAHAAAKGEHVALFTFDESINTLFSRLDGLHIDLRKHAEAGLASVQQVDPAELSPGEFMHKIRHQVEKNGARIIVIDSLNGFLNSMPDERFLIMQLHELLAYLGQRGVATVLIGGAPRAHRHADERAGGRELPRRRGAADALFRVRGRGAPGDLGGEDARRRARAQHPRVQHARRQDHRWRAAARLPRRADRRAGKEVLEGERSARAKPSSAVC
jgi:circadian clock protein KaiC